MRDKRRQNLIRENHQQDLHINILKLLEKGDSQEHRQKDRMGLISQMILRYLGFFLLRCFDFS
jgi:hypothetical protein